MAHTHYASYEHIVFSTKNRVACLPDQIQPELFSWLAGSVKSMGCESIIVGGYSNHAHLLLRKSNEMLTSELVKEIKRTSAMWLSGRKVLNGKFHWQSGYGAFSVSYWDLEKIRAYIANQNIHHKKMTWEIEYKKLLIKHGVEFDERFYLD